MSLRVAVVLLALAFAVLGQPGPAPVDQMAFGYCASVPLGGPCDPYIASYRTNVFFYTPKSVTPAQQQAQLNSSVYTLAQAQSFASGSCGPVLVPFVCASIYPPCVNYPNVVANSSYAFNLTIRRPTCQAPCLGAYAACETFLNNPFVKSQLASVPDVQPFLMCNTTDGNIENRETFPNSPGWNIYGQVVPCLQYLLGSEPPSPVSSPSVQQTAVVPAPPSPTSTVPGVTVNSPPSSPSPVAPINTIATDATQLGALTATLVTFLAAIFAL